MFYTLFALLAGIWALRFASRKARWVRERDPGTERMRAVARAIQEGAMAFLSREYRALGIVVGIVTALLFVGGLLSRDSSFMVALSFVTGAGCSAMAGYIGMRAASDANVRTANAARANSVAALEVAFSGGTVMGLVVAGLSLCGLTVLFLVYAVLFGDATMRELRTVMNVLAGFSLGASSIALFARVGGGIYAAASDLAGRVERGRPEDESQNRVAVADSVGDTVGEIAGIGADLFESHVGSILAAMVLGVAYDTMHLVILPLLLAGVGVAASILGTRLVRIDEAGDPLRALNRGSLGAAALMLTLAYPFAKLLVPGAVAPADNVTGMLHVLTAGGIYLATASGLLAGIAVAVLTEYYTAAARHPVQYVAAQSPTGTATNIIAGLGLGLLSTAWPVMVVAAAIGLAFFFAGLYGIALAGLGMVSTVGLQLAVYAYGPIATNAGGIAGMSELGPEAQERTDRLEAAGYTTAAVGRGFAIGSAALTALALFAAYQSVAGVHAIDVGDPYVMGGLLFGAMLPFLFSAMTLRAVGDVAADMVEEIRHQIRASPGLAEAAARADFAHCVDLGTAAALRRMVVPGAMAVALPVAVGLLDQQALGGMLAGVTVSGALLATFTTNAGSAWGSARRHIEGGLFDGEGSDAKAVAVGDAVGDPFRKAVGPSLGILMKLMAVVALVMAALLA
jgi:K(+)-stimulated pyrophosphate-energized sodium pump